MTALSPRQVFESDFAPAVPTSTAVEPLALPVEQVTAGIQLVDFWAPAPAVSRAVWLVDGLIPASGLVVLAGAPKSFKTLAALQLAVAVSSVSVDTILGGAVSHGPVLFVEEEGDPSQLRQQSFLIAEALKAAPTRFSWSLFQGVLVDQPEWRDRLDQLLGALRPALVVLDPLAFLHDGDENSAADMARLTRPLVALAERHRTCILVIHHTAKPGMVHRPTQGKVRGSTALTAAASATIVFERPDGSDTVKVAVVSRYAPTIKTTFTLDTETLLLLPGDDTATTLKHRCAQVVAFLADRPAPVPITEIEVLLGCSKATARSAVNALVEQGLVSVDKSGRAHRYLLVPGA